MLREYGRDTNESETTVTGGEGQKQRMRIHVLPLYGSLPYSEQMRVFERTPKNHRKIVVSTNVAEASVTIPNIIYVVDCGFVKLRAVNPATGFESLMIVATSQASAKQRAGNKPGFFNSICILYCR
jgi:ATP-dependent RNA helicase DDX35